MKTARAMKWLSKVKELASLITAMTVVIGVLWGAFRFMNKTSGQGAALEEIREQQEVMIDSLTSLGRKVEDLTLTVEGVGENAILIGNYVEGVNKALVFHLQNSAEVTKEDFAKMMDIIDELKKKEQLTALQQKGSTE